MEGPVREGRQREEGEQIVAEAAPLGAEKVKGKLAPYMQDRPRRHQLG